MISIRYAFCLILTITYSCNRMETIAKKGDEVWIKYSIKNKKEMRIDDSYLPSGDLPLRLITGDEWFFPCLDSFIVGMKEGEETTILIPSENAFQNKGVFYKNYPLQDSVYVIYPNDTLLIEFTITKIFSK